MTTTAIAIDLVLALISLIALIWFFQGSISGRWSK
jgi:hypothetical protein